MRTYEVTYNGLTHRVQLSEETAKRLGAQRAVVEQADEEDGPGRRKARSPANKARTPRNKAADEAED